MHAYLLGGVKDEAEIRGHRRTYIGALPGKIVQAVKKAKTMNPVILLDEIDKMAKDIQGDPHLHCLKSLILNKTEHSPIIFWILNLIFQMSCSLQQQILWIDSFPLFDRMEIIQLSGYTEDEKLDIAKNFLFLKISVNMVLTVINLKLLMNIFAQSFCDTHKRQVFVN